MIGRTHGCGEEIKRTTPRRFRSLVLYTTVVNPSSDTPGQPTNNTGVSPIDHSIFYFGTVLHSHYGRKKKIATGTGAPKMQQNRDGTVVVSSH
mmetsp:Transcript_628/g.696  ORF Transcript_628/g.696 Transcript_628/m.696 type:complete len:93 (+) Transcript_628:301-579(+)